MSETSVTLLPGDRLRVERRFLVDGVVTTTFAEGRFQGVQLVGTSEHLVLEDGEKALRLVPLVGISEIVLVETMPRHAAAPADTTWDPGVA